jgi:hypothetical protein
MFDDILQIFAFLRPAQTRHRPLVRKPMAIPLEPEPKTDQLCKKLFTDLDEAEAEVLKDIDDPEKAWPLLCRIRQLRRETYQDLTGLLPSLAISDDNDHQTADANAPVRIVKTPTGAALAVFNGGRSH